MNRLAFYSLLAAGTSALALSTTVRAAEEDSDLGPGAAPLEVIVVSATRTENRLVDVPATITVIDEEKIDSILSTDIRDMLRYEPGVEATNDGRYGLSGFNIRGLTGNRVKIMVDGTEQSEGFSSGPWLNAPRNFVDIDSLEQVEVLRGPASSLYGSDAMAGVVAFRTKGPASYLDEEGNDTGGAAKVLYDSVSDAFAETLTLANRTGKLESLIQYTRRDGSETENKADGSSDDLGNDRTLPDPYDYSTDNILAKLEYQLNDSHRLNLVGEYFRSTSFIELKSLEGPSYSPSYNYSNYTGDDEFERYHIGLTHEWTANNILFDSLVWSLDWQDSDVEELTTNYTERFGYLTRLIDYSHGEEDFQFAAQFDKTVGVHHLTYGASFQHTEQENLTNKYYPDSGADPDIARYTPVVKGKSYGLYLQDQIKLLEGNFLLTPGLRYDRFEADPQVDDLYTEQLEGHESEKVTFRLGAVYKITDTVSVFGQFSQGFKSPELLQLYREDQSSASRGYISLSNPELEPESSDSFEAGFRINSKAASFELTGFYNEYDNFIEQTVDRSGTPTVYQYVNYNEATIKGVEARAALWLDQLVGAPQGMAFQAAVAWAEGDTTIDGEEIPLDSVSPTKAVFGLTYDSPDEVWGAGVNLTLVGAKDIEDVSDESYFAPDSFALVDLTAYYNITPDLALRAAVFNLTDKEYWLWEDVRGYNAETSYLQRYTQPGRNVSVSLKYSF
ncbi:TonB-dependent hemoglobin/transferrin/lactoferrin family receptor [Emcibacter nanhaiensis]|uniref:TonB-dependent hemoglobin/transferrin/lactoferrin family receptor n=1 Tax=Emcibacter nanhaiensis TaxID=1505037 RepID=A0A501PHG7_9PROT|nr:TonB-dependent hemoglobin/transferrin/lactoferrin family receptor [Emcibacter nanhaiensis]TPD59472.1 TonB-dependent hemoglobin/transferrin/lactoferrin family receptor [Emcibacter nanhaiensis]